MASGPTPKNVKDEGCILTPYIKFINPVLIKVVVAPLSTNARTLYFSFTKTLTYGMFDLIG
jgi:hypothetical protein